MALDSLEKRRNVPGVGRPWMRMIHPVATPDEQWRMAVGLTYGGNAIGAPAGGDGTDMPWSLPTVPPPSPSQAVGY
jgi:hypothetical protein